MQRSRVSAFGDRQRDKAIGMMRTINADEFATQRFSTAELPVGDRVAILRDVIGRKCFRVEIEPLPDCVFHMEGVVRTLPGLGIMSTFSRGVRAQRTKELVADGNDCFCLGIVSVGASIISRGGETILLEHGDATLLSAAEPSSVVCHAMSRIVVVAIPAAALRPLVADIDAAVMRAIPRGSEALKLLAAYLGLLEHDIALETPELRRYAANHVYDLVALAVGAARGATDVARDRSIRAARLRGIKADIIDNLGRFDLSIDVIVARHGVTPRYMRKLFEAEGTTYSEFLLGQRLKHAHRLLTDPRLSDRAISSIAFESGFGDLSYFNKTFRRAFGVAPTDVRPSAKGRDYPVAKGACRAKASGGLRS
jgi:AraC-like DNA-binding protein